jgi:hypothetical protein
MGAMFHQLTKREREAGFSREIADDLRFSEGVW